MDVEKIGGDSPLIIERLLVSCYIKWYWCIALWITPRGELSKFWHIGDVGKEWQSSNNHYQRSLFVNLGSCNHCTPGKY